MALHQSQVHDQQQSGQPREHRDMEAEESRERCATHICAAAQEARHLMPGYGHAGRHVGPYLGGEVGNLVPGQQVSAEAEA